ncbi:MAG: hypothetical protein B6I34_03030 [Anaerolineaceae bacterium 4572_32.1]|nr:MAG: hypothetical protein B6I34_03030 [Anaerolineaceae bacterium 4572_32.1]
MKKLMWIAMLVFVLLLSTAVPALASGPLDGRVIFGGSFTLESGETLDGDLAVFGGSVTLEKDSRVNGDVAVMGGSADVAGDVEGDVVVFGGSVDLASTAIVNGELIAFGGSIDRAEGAIVRGNQTEGLNFGDGFRFPGIASVWTNGHNFDWGRWLLRAFLRALKILMSVVLIVVIGVLAAVFLPQHLERVSQAVLVAPAHSWAAGFLTAIAAVLIGSILIATLCLSPFGAVLWLALLIAGVFGWIALSFIVGLKVLENFKARNVTPVMGVVVGGAILSLIAATLWIVTDCCLGWPFVILVGSFGLGAVVLTRLGTQEYVPSPETPPAPQPPVSLAHGEGEYAPAAEDLDTEIDERPEN